MAAAKFVLYALTLNDYLSIVLFLNGKALCIFLYTHASVLLCCVETGPTTIMELSQTYREFRRSQVKSQTLCWYKVICSQPNSGVARLGLAHQCALTQATVLGLKTVNCTTISTQVTEVLTLTQLATYVCQKFNQAIQPIKLVKFALMLAIQRNVTNYVCIYHQYCHEYNLNYCMIAIKRLYAPCCIFQSSILHMQLNKHRRLCSYIYRQKYTLCTEVIGSYSNLVATT